MFHPASLLHEWVKESPNPRHALPVVLRAIVGRCYD